MKQIILNSRRDSFLQTYLNSVQQQYNSKLENVDNRLTTILETILSFEEKKIALFQSDFKESQLKTEEEEDEEEKREQFSDKNDEHNETTETQTTVQTKIEFSQTLKMLKDQLNSFQIELNRLDMENILPIIFKLIRKENENDQIIISFDEIEIENEDNDNNDDDNTKNNNNNNNNDDEDDDDDNNNNNNNNNNDNDDDDEGHLFQNKPQQKLFRIPKPLKHSFSVDNNHFECGVKIDGSNGIVVAVDLAQQFYKYNVQNKVKLKFLKNNFIIFYLFFALFIV